jgi:hypothetical protein
MSKTVLEYNDIYKRVQSTGALLLTTSAEFDKIPGSATKKKVNIKLSCGHDIFVTMNSYQRKLTNKCNDCLALDYKDKNKDLIYAIEENNLFQIISQKINTEFDIFKSNEGCRCDMLVKPKNVTDDKWLPI